MVLYMHNVCMVCAVYALGRGANRNRNRNHNSNSNLVHHAQALPALLLLSPGGERVVERWEAGPGAPASPPELLLRRFLSDGPTRQIATLRQANPDPSP